MNEMNVVVNAEGVHQPSCKKLGNEVEITKSRIQMKFVLLFLSRIETGLETPIT